MRLTKRFFFPDCHTPFVDVKAFKTAVSLMRDFKPDEVVILGDFFDIHMASFHPKDPDRTFRDIETELKSSRHYFESIVSAARKARIIFLCGNHENRIRKYVNQQAPMLAGSLTIEGVLKLPRSVHFLPYGQKNRYHMGKLMATHGTLFSEHVAQAMLRKYGKSVIFGHTHRLQEFNVQTVCGARLKGITIGWLGSMEHAGDSVEDMTDWVHACALSYHYPNGDFVIQSIEIIRGMAVFNGKIYR